MEYILAKNNEEDFEGLLKLEEESDLHYVNINKGTPFIRVPFSEQPRGDYLEDFADYFKDNYYLLFAKNGLVCGLHLRRLKGSGTFDFEIKGT